MHSTSVEEWQMAGLTIATLTSNTLKYSVNQRFSASGTGGLYLLVFTSFLVLDKCRTSSPFQVIETTIFVHLPHDLPYQIRI